MTFTIDDIIKSFGEKIGQQVILRGRVSSVRKMKGFIFADLVEKDSSIQLFIAESIPSPIIAGDLISVAGECFYTKTEEPSIKVKHIEVINKWKAKQGFKTILPGHKANPLKAFIQGSYNRLNVSFQVRGHIRDYLRSKGFLEVQTPILVKNYNGGRSFPVTTHYLNETLGFNRGTMEERMQAVIGMGFDRVFQTGSVFRSSTEPTFTEGYAAYMDWQNGQRLICDLCKYVVQKMQKQGFQSDKPFISDLLDDKWETINFFEACVDHFGHTIEEYLINAEKLPQFLVKEGLSKKSDISLETAADILSNQIIIKKTLPTIINNFPEWSSPLYAHDPSDEKYKSLQRSRVYLPGQAGGFDIGVQENNYDEYLRRVQKQQNLWGLAKDDVRIKDPELEKVLSAGMPPMFGFGLNPDRISKLWNEHPSIDPFE